jgi:hypothetical protein
LIRGAPAGREALLGKTGFGERFLVWLGRPLIKHDISRGLLRYDEVEAQARRPFHETKDFREKYEREIRAFPWHAILSRLAVPEMSAALLKQSTLEALALTARTGLACKIYKNQNGRYPDNGRPRAQDPRGAVVSFTGSRSSTASGAASSSTAWGQRKDDGGRMTYKITQLIMEKDDDWTWRESR